MSCFSKDTIAIIAIGNIFGREQLYLVNENTEHLNSSKFQYIHELKSYEKQSSALSIKKKNNLNCLKLQQLNYASTEWVTELNKIATIGEMHTRCKIWKKKFKTTRYEK